MRCPFYKAAPAAGPSSWFQGTCLAACWLAAIALGCTHTSVLERIPEVAEPPAEFDRGLDLMPGAAAPGACGALGDQTLQGLQNRLAGQSFDLQAAWSRFEAADARARESGAYLMPRLDATVAGNDLTFPSSGLVNPFLFQGAAYDASLAASFEVDLWGRLRNREVAALLEAEASVQDLRSLAISLSSVLAEAWFGIVAERELIALLERQQATSERFLELTQLRFGQGLGPAQDIGRQREQLLSLQGQIELARGRLESLEFQLATLLGSAERETPAVSPGLGPLLAGSARPDLGVPAQLLERRPDLQAARRRVEAADRRAAAAVKEWLPSLSVTALLSGRALEITDVLSNLVRQIGGSGAQSVYAAGGRRARIDQAYAAAEESLYAYAQSLVNAVGEVQTALAVGRSTRELVANLEERLGEARRVLLLTSESYREGATDYLNVLTALLSQQGLEQALVDARRQQLASRLQLCRALGFAPGTSVERLAAGLAAAPETTTAGGAS
ncbi:MAG: TolC family protein [Holophagales bacterium]|nr:TolC family protein [Holophagales bacterium]MYG29128.1 TolC family protein [Holophagales bacterium]MYI80552.1 TolC family protein [Holophagales bacterium]